MDSTEEDFTVHDNVFTENDAINMIRLFNKFKKSPVKKVHSYFERNKTELDNPFEYMINDYLNRIGDKCKIVEYWFRSLWLDLGCHQDLNEYLLTKDNVVNPFHGHIMYLSENTPEAGTILFNSANNNVSIVHPKLGRLVRFKGNIFHYVPNPFGYIFGENGQKYGKYRYALLFNTWDDYIHDPDEVGLKCKTLSIPYLQPMEKWNKVPIFETVPLRDHNFEIRIKYMGDSFRRFKRTKIEKYYVSRRIHDDGIHHRIIQYEVEKNNNVIQEDDLPESKED